MDCKLKTIPPPQTLRVNSLGQASRDTAAGDLQEALAALEFQSSSQTAGGGGVAISVGPAIQAFTDNEIIVSFCGHLTNVDYLAWRLFSPEGRRGEAITQNPLEAANKLVGGRCYEAELICHMFKAFGTKALPKLRGRFSFVCFDSRSVRVFAARDPSGTYPLMYGRNVDGTVVIANFDAASTMFREMANSKLQAVPAGCFIYGHRGIYPQRYAKEETVSQQEAAAAAGAAANALRGLRCASRRSIDLLNRQKCADDDEISIVPSRKLGVPSRGEPSQSGTGEIKASMLKLQAATSLNTQADPWYAYPRDTSSSSSQREKAPELSIEDGSVLDRFETRKDLDTVGERDSLLRPGTAEDHQQAEAVAVKAVAAALRRIASGANMKGMVRMGSSNALNALHMGSASEIEHPMHGGEIVHRPEGMSIHRIPSRSGELASMVKVASFGNLGNIHNISSLGDLHQGGVPGESVENWEGDAGSVGTLNGDNRMVADSDKKGVAWADMSLLVISNNSK